MSQPLLVKISSGVWEGHHDTLRHLIELVATLVQAPLEHTEVHVKHSKRLYHRTTGYAYYNFDGRPFSQQRNQDGDLYGRIHTHPDACELVTIKLYEGYVERYTPGLGYPQAGPQSMHYAKYPTFPYTTLYTWEEEFVYLVAHEFWHIVQYHRPRTLSGRARGGELECEHAAIAVLALYRRVLEMAEPRLSGTGKAAHH